MKIALVTVCVSRWSFLLTSLPGWRQMSGLCGMFIATHPGDAGRADVPDAHVMDVVTDGFSISRLRNAGALLAREVADPDYLLLIDCDIMLQRPTVFAEAIEAHPEADYILDHPYALVLEATKADRKENDPESAPTLGERGKRGTHLVRPDLFFGIHGYDQRMSGWGYEDYDLFHRYRLQSDRVGYFDRSGLIHQPHDNRLRAKLNPADRPTLDDSVRLNKQVRREQFDPTGGSWADEMGYEHYEVARPTKAIGEVRDTDGSSLML